MSVYICHTDDSHSQGLCAIFSLRPVTETGQHGISANSVAGRRFGRLSLALFDFRSDLDWRLREE